MSGLQSTQEKRLAQRKRAGRIVPVAVQQSFRPRGQFKRNCCVGTKVDWKINEAFIAEAERRGVHKAALLGRLIEVIVADDLFNAVLDDRG